MMMERRDSFSEMVTLRDGRGGVEFDSVFVFFQNRSIDPSDP